MNKKLKRLPTLSLTDILVSHDVLALREGALKLTIFLKIIISNANITFIYKII